MTNSMPTLSEHNSMITNLKILADSRKSHFVHQDNYSDIHTTLINTSIDTITLNTKYLDKINIANINNCNYNLDFMGLSNIQILHKIFNIPHNIIYTYESIMKKNNMKTNLITTVDITLANNKLLKQIIYKIYKLNKKKSKIIHTIDKDIDCSTDQYALKIDAVIVFVFSGGFKYYNTLLQNNKMNIIQSVKPFYTVSFKYKTQAKDINNIRCLVNYDPITKIMCRSLNYVIDRTIMSSIDSNVVRSLSTKNKQEIFSFLQNTICYMQLRKNEGDKIILLDLHKAFDNVNITLLCDILTNKYNFPCWLINSIKMIQDIDNNTKKLSNPFHINGIKLGNPKSTTLWNLFHFCIYLCIKQDIPNIDFKFYVDDISIYYNKNTPNSIIDADILKIIDIYKLFGFTINNTKTQYINYNDEETAKLHDKKYLGALMSTNISDVMNMLNQEYGEELLINLNDKTNTDMSYLNVIIEYKNKNRTCEQILSYLNLSIMWRLMFYFKNKTEQSAFEIALKERNEYIYDIYLKKQQLLCNHNTIYNEIQNNPHFKYTISDIDTKISKLNLKPNLTITQLMEESEYNLI